MNKRLLFSLLAVSVAAACQAQADTFPDPVGPSQSDFGGVGLLQVPTARMAREGEFSLNFRDNDQYRYYSASLQLLPWLETTVRYTDVRTRRYSAVESFSGNQSYKDKAFDLKLRLLKESYWLPEVALGSRDLGGTGLFDSEYLVASKAWGPFDFTLGLGWGYLGNSGTVKNPFCSYSDSYCQRPGVGEAGSINGSQMFHGPSALFGGVEYQTPWQPLRLKLEYEGNNYQDDFAGRLEQRSKVNVGAIYRVTDWADINASYERGNTFMFGVTVRTNFNDLRQTHIDSAKPEYRPQPQESMLEPTVVASQLSDLKYNAGLSGPRIQTRGSTLFVSGEQTKYRDTREGVDRANRIIMNNLPAGIETIEVTESRFNMPQVTTRTDVNSLRNQLAGYPLGQEQPLRQTRENPVDAGETEQGFFIRKERLNYSLSPVLNQSVGGPESFYMYQVGVMGNLDYWRQRDWDNMMQFTNYKAPTGHVTAYWRPWFMQDLLVKASVGQYLAKDKGVTIDVSKRFDSGVMVGVYATKTNVSSEQYGEGDFTKGFYLSIPMDLFTVTPTRGRAQVNWVPLTRDGGQMLGRKYQLYDLTSDRDARFN